MTNLLSFDHFPLLKRKIKFLKENVFIFFLSDAVLSPRGLHVHIVYSYLFHFSQYDGCYLMDESGDWQHNSPRLCLVGLFVSEVPWDCRSGPNVNLECSCMVMDVQVGGGGRERSSSIPSIT